MRLPRADFELASALSCLDIETGLGQPLSTLTVRFVHHLEEALACRFPRFGKREQQFVFLVPTMKKAHAWHGHLSVDWPMRIVAPMSPSPDLLAHHNALTAPSVPKDEGLVVVAGESVTRRVRNASDCS